MTDNVASGIKTEGLQKMKTKIEHYWQFIKPNAEIAMILDPRFKLDLIESKSEKKRARSDFDLVFNEYDEKLEEQKSDNPGSSNSLAKKSNSSQLTKIKENIQRLQPLAMRLFSSDKNTQKSELIRYFSEPRVVMSDEHNILKWWKDNQSRFPTLAKMARDYLAMQASSVPSERGFSKSGLTVSNLRNRLNPETVRYLMCLQSWFKLKIP